MTDIDLTAAIRPTSDAIYRQLSGQYGDFSTPSDEEAEAVLKAALPHILDQVEARVKPDRLDVMPTRDEIARIVWIAMEGGEIEGRTDGPLDWDYAAADAVLALLPGKTEQEIREEIAAEIASTLPGEKPENPYAYDPWGDDSVDPTNLDEVVSEAVGRGWSMGSWVADQAAIKIARGGEAS